MEKLKETLTFEEAKELINDIISLYNNKHHSEYDTLGFAVETILIKFFEEHKKRRENEYKK